MNIRVIYHTQFQTQSEYQKNDVFYHYFSTFGNTEYFHPHTQMFFGQIKLGH